MWLARFEQCLLDIDEETRVTAANDSRENIEQESIAHKSQALDSCAPKPVAKCDRTISRCRFATISFRILEFAMIPSHPDHRDHSSLPQQGYKKRVSALRLGSINVYRWEEEVCFLGSWS